MSTPALLRADEPGCPWMSTDHLHCFEPTNLGVHVRDAPVVIRVQRIPRLIVERDVCRGAVVRQVWLVEPENDEKGPI